MVEKHKQQEEVNPFFIANGQGEEQQQHLPPTKGGRFGNNQKLTTIIKKITAGNIHHRRKMSKLTNLELQNSPQTVIEQDDDDLTSSGTMGVAENGKNNEDEGGNGVPNEEKAEIRNCLKKPSLTMSQHHSLDSAPFKKEQEIQQKAVKKGSTEIRRSSTTPANRKLTMVGYRYARRPTEISTSFPVPPVFPKTCSLFDPTFSGGAYADTEEDRKLMDALIKVRTKINGGECQEEHQTTHHQMAIEDQANLSDSGNSSEGTSTSPPLSHYSFFGETTNIGKKEDEDDEYHHQKDVPSIFLNTPDIDDKFTEGSSMGGGKYNHKIKRKSDIGLNIIRKNSRILFFRQRAKTNSGKCKSSEKTGEEQEEDINSANGNANNELPTQAWTIDGSKGLSWKCKLLKTLSAGGIHLSGSGGDRQKGEKPSDHHFGKLDREWEVVTVRELCRRLSLEDSLEPSELPLPEGALQSQVLDEFMLRQIVDILPPRAEGYPWVNIYSSEKHGFSLSTLYRKMSEWKEEVSPILLIIRDVQGHVFGAITSMALKPAEYYYGTGDACLLFRFTGEYPHTRELRTYNWTGDNQFFVNATREFLSVGAGGGHYGLWLDADLNNGRSQKCATFDNEPLAGGEDEDFVIQFVEAFGFSMS